MYIVLYWKNDVDNMVHLIICTATTLLALYTRLIYAGVAANHLWCVLDREIYTPLDAYNKLHAEL